MTETQRILVDTNVIVYAYEMEVWENMLEEAEIITATSVVQDEAKFYSQEQEKVMIDLPGLVESRDLIEVDPAASQVRKFHENFDKFFSELIHEGERDIFAHLLSIEGEKPAFCSADCTALKALAMLGMSALGISPKLAEEAPGLALGRNRLVFVQQSIEDTSLKNCWLLFECIPLIQGIARRRARLTAGSCFVKDRKNYLKGVFYKPRPSLKKVKPYFGGGTLLGRHTSPSAIRFFTFLPPPSVFDLTLLCSIDYRRPRRPQVRVSQTSHLGHLLRFSFIIGNYSLRQPKQCQICYIGHFTSPGSRGCFRTWDGPQLRVKGTGGSHPRGRDVDHLFIELSSFCP